MSVSLKIKEFLEDEDVPYEILEHGLAYTALEIAQAQHLPGHQVVKSIVVEAGGKSILCVLSATHLIDFNKLKNNLFLKEASLADEAKVASLFKGCEVGAMPPFGQLAGIPTYVDSNLSENETIAFNAGTHTEMFKVKFKDFMRIVNPIVIDFSVHI